MMGKISDAVSLLLIPVALCGLGGLIAALFPPSRKVRAVLQHTAAGVVFGAAAIELVPEVHAYSPVVAIVGFALGIAAMLFLQDFSSRAESKISSAPQSGPSRGLIGATAVDLFLDGLITGAGFAANTKMGRLLVLALILEFFFLGMSLAADYGPGSPKWKIVGVPLALASLSLPGVIAGLSVLSALPPVYLGGTLSFGAVALMYLVTEELLVEAHEGVTGAHFATAFFFLGFLVYLIVSELA